MYLSHSTVASFLRCLCVGGEEVGKPESVRVIGLPVVPDVTDAARDALTIVDQRRRQAYSGYGGADGLYQRPNCHEQGVYRMFASFCIESCSQWVSFFCCL